MNVVSSTQKTGVLLVNLGTPTAPTAPAIRRYLADFLSDPRVIHLPRWLWLPLLYGFVLPFRPKRLVKLYESIWWPEGSPMRVISKKQAYALAAELGEKFCVRLAMCYGEPSLAEALADLKQQAIQQLIVLPLYPQYSSTTTAAVFDRIARLLRQHAWLPQLRFINNYPTHPEYIKALAQRITQHWAQQGQADKLLFSFHGIPKRYVEEGDPYIEQCHATAAAVATALQLPATRWQVAFQSRFGASEWVRPYTDETLTTWANQKVSSVDVIAPGFAADCLETLEELAIRNKELFLAQGGQHYRYISALNDTPAHIAFLAELIKSHQSFFTPA